MAATLAHLGPHGDLLEHQVELACLLEVSAPKPGNITPAHEFADATFADMVRSALALGPVFSGRRAGERGVGELIADGVRATGRVARANTNLGIVLLFAPLVRAQATRGTDEELRGAVERTLAELDVQDAAAAFAAIVEASPGGLGAAPEHDVRTPAQVTLREAMAAAADRDSVAAEYATGYQLVFEAGMPLLTEALAEGLPTLQAIAALYIGLLATHPDTLIARKAGMAAARAVTSAAVEVLDGRRSAEEFDAWLRRAGNRYNPGTTADLVAATLLVGLLCEMRLP